MNYEFEYTKTLEEAGFTDKEAEATIKMVLDMMDSKVASKIDLEKVESSLRSDMKEIRSDMEKMEYRLIISVGKMIVGAVGLVSAVVGAFAIFF